MRRQPTSAKPVFAPKASSTKTHSTLLRGKQGRRMSRRERQAETKYSWTAREAAGRQPSAYFKKAPTSIGVPTVVLKLGSKPAWGGEAGWTG